MYASKRALSLHQYLLYIHTCTVGTCYKIGPSVTGHKFFILIRGDIKKSREGRQKPPKLSENIYLFRNIAM